MWKTSASNIKFNFSMNTYRTYIIINGIQMGMQKNLTDKMRIPIQM